MGYNTVVMILNDHMHNIAEAPHSFTWALTNPPHGDGKAREMWLAHAREVAIEHGENRMFSPTNDINMLPTFHADNHHWLYAGRNTLESLRFHKFGTAMVRTFEPREGGGSKPVDSRKKTVTLVLPDWWHTK